jgi:hypothetical protein
MVLGSFNGWLRRLSLGRVRRLWFIVLSWSLWSLLRYFGRFAGVATGLGCETDSLVSRSLCFDFRKVEALPGLEDGRKNHGEEKKVQYDLEATSEFGNGTTRGNIPAADRESGNDAKIETIDDAQWLLNREVSIQPTLSAAILFETRMALG